MTTKDISKHAKELSKLGAAKGGKARAARLTPEERSAIAREAAEKRWAKESKIPRATHAGVLTIGNIKIPCAVLDDETRVLTQAGMLEALGRSRKPTGGTTSLTAEGIPPFLASKNLEAYLDEDSKRASTPILFKPLRSGGYGGNRAYGYRADLLPKVCELMLKAREDGVLQENQKHIARAAEILVRALAGVGITALVDEATGFQEDRDRWALHKILEEYISPELLPWTKRFPNEFYKQLFRLRDWSYSPLSVKRPILVGKLTNRLVYDQLPPGVKEKLQELNPVLEKGHRQYHHHRFLTEDIGNPHLERQLAAVVALMKVAPDWETFMLLFERAFPSRKTAQLSLPAIEDNMLKERLATATDE